MRAFDYAAPKDLKEAVALLQQGGERARVLSGGTDLIVQVREKRRDLDLMIDVKRIPELLEIRYDSNTGLTLGASVACNRIYEHPVISRTYPGLVDAAFLIGGTQIQNRASLGGNLCNASPAADSVPALIVHHAVCFIVGPQGERELPVEQFCVAPGRSTLQAGELLVSFRIPPPPLRFGAHYLRFIPRNEMDIAVVGCGASLSLEEDVQAVASTRVALGAVAPTPLLVGEAAAVLVGRPFSPEGINNAAAAAQAAARPISDMRGTAEYRRHLVGVLTRRALLKAFERAKEASHAR
ncbi:MAG: xanthine dehydrogenase family protein subunit M [Acidobacteria bacterium]|nr:xanthine dehydrogenase family protein subunit M [Acidobacteriota bacterium]MCI0624097.1 xanthine dehydrogenase family protein subunit M [Acidobacteriota bacterium]MCI0720076.1 xanthine dehydrogenase family protein subunit M [Acidobacteriota bacterium]